MNRLRAKAFTVIELVITLAVLAILTSLAYSSYVESVRKSNRGDAQAALTGLASAMQRFYTEATPSTIVGTAASGPPGPTDFGSIPGAISNRRRQQVLRPAHPVRQRHRLRTAGPPDFRDGPGD